MVEYRHVGVSAVDAVDLETLWQLSPLTHCASLPSVTRLCGVTLVDCVPLILNALPARYLHTDRYISIVTLDPIPDRTPRKRAFSCRD